MYIYSKVKIYRLLIFGVLILTGFYGCEEPVQVINTQNIKVKEVMRSDSLKVIDFYKGGLPCADCEGIIQQLWLMRKEVKDTIGVYLLRETFTEAKDKESVINTRGLWSMHHDLLGSDDAMIIELKGDSSTGFEKRFYQLKENSLMILDGRLRKTKKKYFYLFKEPW